MKRESRDNSGVLFKNKRKEQPNHPDYEGSIVVAGVDCWLKAWIKVPQSGGDKFLSLSCKPKEERGNASHSQKPAPQPETEEDFGF